MVETPKAHQAFERLNPGYQKDRVYFAYGGIRAETKLKPLQTAILALEAGYINPVINIVKANKN